jgi:hypothetical protein
VQYLILVAEKENGFVLSGVDSVAVHPRTHELVPLNCKRRLNYSLWQLAVSGPV